MSIPEAAPFEEFLEHLNVTSTDDEAELLRILRAATGAAEGLIGPIIIRAFTANTAGSGSLVLPRWPVVSVESVTHAFGHVGPYATADLAVDPDGLVQLAHGGSLPSGRFTVAYTAGRWATASEVDEDVRLAVCIIGKHLWETQRGRASRPGIVGRQTAQDDSERVPAGYLIPNRASTLLGPYWQLGAI